MNLPRARSILRFALTTSALTLAAAATDAAAQTAPQDPPAAAPQASTSDNDEIVITGSRIARRRGDETASPLQTITSQDLDARGYQTVAQALNELPSFGVPGASPVGFNQSSFGAGQSFVDFLGLGSQRTLTLVNGRRFVSGNTASIFGPTGSGGNQVDLNVIPTKLIDRVETVAAIGAPIYGSDAIAGTINIILKKNYEGLDIDVQSGVSARGDAPDYRVRLLAGQNFAGGRGNITISGEYNQSKGLFFNDRQSTSSDDRFDVAPSGSGPQVIWKDERIPSISPYGIPLVYDFINTAPGAQSVAYIGDPTLNVGVVNAAGQQLKFDQQGNLTPIDFGTVVGATADGSNIFSSGGNGFTLRDVENLLTDVKRYSANMELSYDITDNIRFFGEGWYSVSQGRNLANQPVYNSALFGGGGQRDGNLILSVNNPFLTPQARTTIIDSINNSLFTSPGQDYFYLGRANVDLSSGVSTGKSEIMRFVGGFDGKVNVLPAGEWRFEAYFNYGRSKVTSRNPELNEQNFLNAIGGVTTANPNGVPCLAGYTNSPIATLSPTCVAINPFGSQISDAAKAYITTIATPMNLNNQYDGVASISGPLFNLPGGDFSFALGFEHRAEDSTFTPGAFYQGATTDQYPGEDFDGDGDPIDLFYGRSVPIRPVFGKYHTNEIFGELNADLVSAKNNIPFIYELSFQAAGRYIWNSQAGNDPTYTFQGRYAPVRDITFRAAYTRAVRAPSITEAFNPSSSAYGFATDVCDKSLRNSGPDPTSRAANCLAAGVPTNLTSQSNARSFPTFVIGNPTLQNEKSDNITVGAVITPRFIPGFSATIDYVDIRLKNAISQFSNSQVVAACYDATNFPNNQFCSLITRDFSGTPGTNNNYGQLSNVGTTYFNSAELRYKGILAEVSYRTATNFLGKGSHLGFDINYQYLDTLSTIVTAGSAPVHTSNSVGYSRNKGVATIRYDNGGFFGQVQVNYIGKARIDPDTALNFYAVPEVNAFTYVNFSARYDVNKNFSLNVDVDNVFDVKPPYPYPASGGTSTYFQGILGTYFRIGAAVHF
jgi:outer membrane receptor protein involved in Fe transport